MLNTPENDAPYVTGAIFDPATADFDNLNAAHVGGFDGETVNPIVVNADGSFVAAFAVNAPSYFFNSNLPATPSGTLFLSSGRAIPSEYFFFDVAAASPGSVVYTFIGRDSAGVIVNLPVTPTNGRITVTEAMLANFAPCLIPTLSISGLAASSTVSVMQQVDAASFYDAAAPTVDVQAISSVPVFTAGGNGALFVGSGIAESFTLQNTAVWTTGATVFRLVIDTQEQIDLTGFSGTVLLTNSLIGAVYRTVITVAPEAGVVAVPPTILQQLQSHPGSVALAVNGAVVGTTPQAQATVQLPVTIITEGLYTQHFDADGNPLADAVRVDAAPDALIYDEDGEGYTMSRSADGGLVIAWLGNADEDGEADAVYVRKLDDAGVPADDTVGLTGLSPEAINVITDGDGTAVLAGLADGGFAIAYTVEAETFSATGSAFGAGPNGTASVTFSPLRGQLEDLLINSSDPISALLASEPRSGFVLEPDPKLS